MVEGSVINTIVIRKRTQEIEEEMENFKPSLLKILFELKQCSNDKVTIFKEGKF